MAEQLTFGSLFAGFGGMDLGFERAGMRCVWQVEIDDYATRVLQKHWPDVHRERDIRECGKHNLESVDVICGGDPCQGNSIAGVVWNREHDDLGSEFLRCVEEICPRVVVREHPYVTRPNARWPWRKMRSSLEQLGYAVLPFRIYASAVGAFHRRCRIILVGERPHTNGERPQGIDGKGVEAWDTGRVGGNKMSPFTRPTDLCSTSRVCGTDYGISNRVERLRGIGNAVVPQVAKWIGRQIVEAANIERV